LPDCRLPLADYHDADPAAPDRTYGTRAALLDGFVFDPAAWRIPQQTAASTDPVQWLALTVAREALEDAGYYRDRVPRERTGVVVGNTLTGEHTRTCALRLRWPFVRRTLLAAAASCGLSAAAEELASAMEELYKGAFPAITEDTLAGSLSNTIAGRICNWFDLHGGGYTVDGACASSLLAVCTAADSLVRGDLDLALAGGVDVSLDPFELVGFAKIGALSPDVMRVYDRDGNGFLPGEGCGFVVLRRLEDARAAGDTIYAVVRGWGVSSDGRGGLTAPRREGQALALQRAYTSAGFSPATVDFIEGHGTGTRVGDTVELEALGTVAEEDGPLPPRRIGITSLKSIIGHTKAAAGIGAFIKTTLAVHRRVLPPTAGCHRPHAAFDGAARSLYPIREGVLLDPVRTVRAGVSAMGFGGINAHVVLESAGPPVARSAPTLSERSLLASAQETELFVLGEPNSAALAERLTRLAERAERLSDGDLTDLAAALGRDAPAAEPCVRVALVAQTSDELADLCRSVARKLREDPLPEGRVIQGPRRAWQLGDRAPGGPVGFLFPGQGSQQLQMGRRLVERHEWARELVAEADGWLRDAGLPPIGHFLTLAGDRLLDLPQWTERETELRRTETAQPAICLASLLWARWLRRLGVVPAWVGGHSLGELTAFHLAGAFDAADLIRFAGVRGRAMAAQPGHPGAMAALSCAADQAEALVSAAPGCVVVANRNGPRQTVVSGEEAVVADLVERAARVGISGRRLPVGNAFHSHLMRQAAEFLRGETILPERTGALASGLVSGMTGQAVAVPLDLRAYFAAQVVAPVDFISMVNALRREVRLLLEVGPGRVLSDLATHIPGPDAPCLPVASDPVGYRDSNVALAACFVHGLAVSWPRLYEDRLVRPLRWADERVFLANPCERPFPKEAPASSPRAAACPTATSLPLPQAIGAIEAALFQLAAERTGFPSKTLGPTLRLLDDLNLDSIKAAELVAATARAFGIAGRIDASRYANATFAEVADAIRQTLETTDITSLSFGDEPAAPEPGWVRNFVLEFIPMATDDC
jgi:enediyne polyketide synthase